jgi:hypothetical protein
MSVAFKENLMMNDGVWGDILERERRRLLVFEV